MTVTRFEIRSGAYFDSVVLMQLQRALADLPGIVDAGVVMATEANRDLLAQSQLLPAGANAGPDDLLLVVRAEGEEEARRALAQVDGLLTRRRSAAEGTFRPRSLGGAVKALPEAGWAVVSVPGRYAAGVAREALDLDLHVFLYSDNVSLEDEIALKRAARSKGLLLMGPDCGTAIINGVGLGFANRVRRGSIGVVAASGTGLQAVVSRVHNLGGGVSHAIGTGGRDLKAEVGGATTRQGLDLLARDPSTRVLVLISKPPDPEVAAGVLAAARVLDKPVVVDFIGYAAPARRLGSLRFANDLNDAAELAVELAGDVEREGRAEGERDPLPGGGRRYLRGLFSGGTLAYEAARALEASLSPVYSNVSVRPEGRLPDPFKSKAHTLVDLGEDVFTVGRLHPMIDNDLRLRRLKQEAADPEVALILLDVVLGEGAHPDPAAELAPAIARVREAHAVEVVLILVGTDEDPQDLAAQRRRFAEAGARVFEGIPEAVAYITSRLAAEARPATPGVALDRLATPLAAVNVGLEAFYESLVAQGAAAVHVDWRPPAGGDERLMAILEKMRGERDQGSG